MDFLFILVDWHSLMKLRMHTDHTLGALTRATRVLGQACRNFSDVMDKAFDAQETPSEVARRARRQASHPSSKTTSTTRKTKKLNLNTPKFHMLGYYHLLIPRFGPSDCCSTRPVSAFLHRQITKFKS